MVLQTTTQRHDLRARSLRVASVTDLGGPMRRIRFAGPDLDGFEAPGPADHIKLFVPDHLGNLNGPWMDGADMVRPDNPGPVRDYTPMNFRPARTHSAVPTLDVDVVMHEQYGAVTRWAASAAPGDIVVIAGPRGSKITTGMDSLVLGADETALPAVSRWLDQHPGLPATVLIEVSHSELTDYLYPVGTANHTVAWLDRGATPPGQSGVLLEALTELISPTGPRRLPGDEPLFWFAGEATTLVPIRRALRRHFDRSQVIVDGYWKFGQTARDHHEPLDPSDPD